MTRVLVTGGTGTLGREVVRQLLDHGYSVRVMSQGERKAQMPTGVEWAQADLATGAGVTGAVAHVDVVVHAATSPSQSQRIDVEGTRVLLTAARMARVRHFVYVSIVGIDRIPLRYYRHKLAAEQLVRDGRNPWTILRATQFHTLIDMMASSASRRRLMMLPTDFQYQLLDPGEAATRLVEIVGEGPQRDAVPIGGPEVLTFGAMTRTWLAARGLERRIIHLPLPGRIAHAFRHGFNTCPDQPYGRISWSDWLKTSDAHEHTDG